MPIVVVAHDPLLAGSRTVARPADVGRRRADHQLHVARLDDPPQVAPVKDVRSACSVNVTRAEAPASSGTRA